MTCQEYIAKRINSGNGIKGMVAKVNGKTTSLSNTTTGKTYTIIKFK